MKGTFYLENLGCAKNQVDAEIMIHALTSRGWEMSSEPTSAQVLIINSCGFIDAAKRESVETAINFRAGRPDATIIMAGCLSQRYRAQLAAELGEVDGFVGNRAPERIAEALDEIIALRRSGVSAGYRAQAPSGAYRGAPFPERSLLLSFPGSAYVKVAEGCSNCCAFCAIPLIRGALRSRTPGSVVDEIRTLLERGIREINLVAHDLGAFGSDRGSSQLSELLSAISRLEGDFWVRLLYLYPETFPMEIVSVIRADPRILPYFDIPVQHAASSVLERMGRTGRRETFLSLINDLRGSLPDAVIRSTFLVGFPGESDRDFKELMEFQYEAGFDWLGVFEFSAEEGTPAFRLPRGLRVSRRIAGERKRRVEEQQREITFRRMDRFVGRVLPVLIEERVEKESLAIGRAFCQGPAVDGSAVVGGSTTAGPGELVRVRIVRRNGIDLEGRIVS